MAQVVACKKWRWPNEHGKIEMPLVFTKAAGECKASSIAHFVCMFAVKAVKYKNSNQMFF